LEPNCMGVLRQTAGRFVIYLHGRGLKGFLDQTNRALGPECA